MKNRKAIITVLAVLLVAAIAIGSTLAFLTDSDQVVNTFVLGEDIEIDLDEPSYEDPYEFSPGRAYAKDPIVTAEAGDMFMRMIVGFYNVNRVPDPDNAGEYIYVTGDLIDCAVRLALLRQMVWYDTDFTAGNLAASTPIQPIGGFIPISPVTNPPTPLNAADQLDLEELWDLEDDGDIYNPFLSTPNIHPQNNFAIDTARSAVDAGRYVFNYIAPAVAPLPANVFSANTGVTGVDADTARLFTTVVFPSCWSNTEMRILRGDDRSDPENPILGYGFQIIVRAEAIQITGFASSAIAFEALDDYSPWITP